FHLLFLGDEKAGKKNPAAPWMFSSSGIPGWSDSSISERNVVIKAVVIRHLLRLRLLRWLLSLLLRRCLTLGCRTRLLWTRSHAFTTLGAAVQQLHLTADINHDLGGVALHTVFFPLTCLQATFNVQLGALAYIFADDFRQTTEEHHTVPFSTLLLLAALLVLPAVGRRQGDVGYRVAVGHVAYFRVTAHVTDQDYFIDASGHSHSPRVSGVFRPD